MTTDEKPKRPKGPSAKQHQKKEVFAAVHAHIARHGTKKWALIHQAFPEITATTLKGWIDEAKALPPPPDQLADAGEALAETMQGARVDRPKPSPAGRHLPAAPSPAYIARNGERGLQNIDFVAEIQKLYRDAEMLRNYGIAIRKGENGEDIETIKNPIAFDKSIARRAGLLETAIRAVQEIWDLRTMQNFYETIIEEIGKADPETQRRIIDRLAELNSRTGMTMASMRV